MLISNESHETIEISSIDEPVSIDHFWIMDLQQKDFMLSKLMMLEEFTSPTLTLDIFGQQINIPVEWHILVYSPETSVVDMVQISDLTRSDFCIFLYDHTTSKILENRPKVVDYTSNQLVHAPAFNKNSMLCHPVGSRYWIMIAPTDTYNKYLKDTVTIGNFLY